MENTVAATEEDYMTASTESQSPIKGQRRFNISSIHGKSKFSPLQRQKYGLIEDFQKSIDLPRFPSQIRAAAMNDLQNEKMQ